MAYYDNSAEKPSYSNRSSSQSIISALSSESPMDETEELKSAADNSSTKQYISHHALLNPKSLPHEKEAPRVAFVLGHPGSGNTLLAESLGDFAARHKSTFISRKRATRVSLSSKRVHLFS